MNYLYKLIAFDLDGTLAESKAMIAPAMAEKCPSWEETLVEINRLLTN